MTIHFDLAMPILEKISKEIIRDVLRDLARRHLTKHFLFQKKKKKLTNPVVSILGQTHTVEHYAAPSNDRQILIFIDSENVFMVVREPSDESHKQRKALCWLYPQVRADCGETVRLKGVLTHRFLT